MKALRKTLTQVFAVSVLALGASSAFALAAAPDVPKPSCDDVKKADETLCANTWHGSKKTDADWLNYKQCMRNALDAWLECINPPTPPAQ